ncbi:MAG TPA: Ig-like domain-containing protein, partial [Daejeonella sp.]|nr:Ig-like domain-containing protein [Daejeonella sp.]
IVDWVPSNYDPEQPGTYLFTGNLLNSDDIDNPDSLKAKLSVIVGDRPLKVISVVTDSITVPFGTSFTDAMALFPKQVKVNYDNGTDGLLNVIWHPGEYESDEPGVYQITGELELAEDVVNPDDIMALLDIKVGNHIIQTVINPEELTEPYGTTFSDLTLPNEVTVVFVDGGSREITVNWDQTGFDGNTAGTYVIKGDFVLPDDVSNPQNLRPEIKITIRERVKILKGFEEQTIYVEYGTDITKIPFPAKAMGKLDEGPNIELDMIASSWTTEFYDPVTSGEYIFKGEAMLPETIQNPDNLLAELKVVVGNRYIKALVPVDTLSVPYGTLFSDITLPEFIKVIYNNDSEEDIPVMWTEGDYNGNIPGIYNANGTLMLPGDVDNPNNLQPVLQIQVQERIKLIVGVEPQLVEVPFGTDFSQVPLPSTVKVTFDDGTTGSLSVKNWIAENYESNIPGTYEVLGEIVIPEGVQNPNDLPALLKVTVENKYIISVEPLEDLTVPYGTDYDELILPITVKVTYSDQSTDQLQVEWSPGNYQSIPGEYILKGDILTSSEENKNNLSASIKVIVENKLLHIVSVAPVQFTVSYGTSLADVINKLGTQVAVVYNDGSEGTANVVWETELYLANQAGIYRFTGTLIPASGTDNPSDLQAKADVTVALKNIIQVGPLPPVEAIYGHTFSELSLPLTVRVTYEDLSTDDLPVVWDASAYLANTLAEQTISGEIQLPDDISNTNDLKATIKVTLFRDIETVAEIADIIVPYGTAYADLNLPATIKVTYNDGSEADLAITWNESSYGQPNAGEVLMTGILTLEPSTYNTKDLAAQVKIIVEKVQQTIDFEAIADKKYGDPAFTIKATASSGLPITYVLLEGQVSLENDLVTIFGTGRVSIKAVQAGNENFEAAEVTRQFIINKASLTLTAENKQKVYGDENPELTFKSSGFVYSDDETVLEVQPVLSTPANQNSGVGKYAISIDSAKSENYDITFIGGELEITKAKLLVKAEDKSRKYGEADPEFTFVYNGFITGDDETVLSTKPKGSTTANSSSPVGNYDILASGAVADNYEIEYENGVLSIEKTILIITAEDKIRNFGVANPELTVS